MFASKVENRILSDISEEEMVLAKDLNEANPLWRFKEINISHVKRF